MKTRKDIPGGTAEGDSMASVKGEPGHRIIEGDRNNPDNNRNFTAFPGAKERVRCLYDGGTWVIGLYEIVEDTRRILEATSGHKLFLDEGTHWKEAGTLRDLGMNLPAAVQKLLEEGSLQ